MLTKAAAVRSEEDDTEVMRASIREIFRVRSRRMKDENTQRDEKDTVFRSYRERICFRQLFHSMLLCIILFFSIE